MSELMLQAIVFTGLAVLVFGGLTWFVFLSPLKAPVQAAPLSRRWVLALSILLSLSMFQGFLGGWWDASLHIKTGLIPAGEDFLWPPHLLLYSAFLIMLVIGLVGLIRMAFPALRAGILDPRRWLRAQPQLAIVCVASLYVLMTIPGDAIWHLLFGVDLTAWSPPHMLIAFMMYMIFFAVISLLISTYSTPRAFGLNLALLALLGLMANVMYVAGVVEWEFPDPVNLNVAARPVWAYPVVVGAIGVFCGGLAKRLVPGRWSATVTALVFYAMRAFVNAWLTFNDTVAPTMPLVFILGAVLMDVAEWREIRLAWRRVLISAAAFTLGYCGLSLPQASQHPYLSALPANLVLTIVIIFALSVALLFAAEAIADRLNGAALHRAGSSLPKPELSKAGATD